MKIRRHRAKYKTPNFDELYGAFIDMREKLGAYVNLCRISPKSMMEMKARRKEKVYGVPVYLCIYEDKVVEFYPIPDKDYEVKMRVATVREI